MEALLLEYLPILIFLGVAIGVAAAAVGASLLLARQNPDSEKLSPYECGFEAFDDARRKFDVRFYLVAILFIIFDLEVAFLFPWAISLRSEEHTSELQSLMRISYAVFCLKKKTMTSYNKINIKIHHYSRYVNSI